MWPVYNYFFMPPKVTLLKTLTKEKYKFPCNRWLDTSEDDNEVVRELPATGDLIQEPLTGKRPRYASRVPLQIFSVNAVMANFILKHLKHSH